MEQPGYEEDRCHFCGGKEAGFQMREEGTNKNGEYFDACEPCIRTRITQGKD